MMTDRDEIGTVIAEVGGLPGEVGVCLAVYGADLDPVDVTSRLGCAPTRSHRRGDRQASKSPPFKLGAWLLEERGFAPVGPDELVARLLRRLTADLSVWEALASDYRVELRFGIHFTGWNRGFDLSPEIVSQL